MERIELLKGFTAKVVEEMCALYISRFMKLSTKIKREPIKMQELIQINATISQCIFEFFHNSIIKNSSDYDSDERKQMLNILNSRFKQIYMDEINSIYNIEEKS